MVVEDATTVELDNDGVAEVLGKFSKVLLLDLATHGVTEMSKR